MMSTKLCIFTLIVQGATALRLREEVLPQYADAKNYCTGQHTTELIEGKGFSQNPQPKVAWIIAEKLDRFPRRYTERMRRMEKPLEGADLFIAAELEDMDAIEFLPKPTRVGIFNYSYKSFIAGLKHLYFHNNRVPGLSVYQGSFFQFIRQKEAMDLVREQEAIQGWKYDMIFRMRSELIVKDICHGADHGLMQRGALLCMMKHEAKRNKIVHTGDWYQMGLHDEMMNLAQEFRYPFTNQNITLSCETNKDKKWNDVRQCTMSNLTRTVALRSPNPRHAVTFEHRHRFEELQQNKTVLLETRHSDSFKGGPELHLLETQEQNAAKVAGQMENHVTTCIERLKYQNAANGKAVSSGVVALRRFQKDYNMGEIANVHGLQSGCAPYPAVGDK